MKTKLLLLAGGVSALLGLSCWPVSAAAEVSSARIDGTWTWDFKMPDGAVVSPKATLRQDGEQLAGSASFRPGTETAISNGRINGDEISFEVVRERDGRKIVTRYTGRVTGGVIRGTLESNWAGEWQSYAWTASKPILAPNSVWNSIVTLPDNQKQRWKMRFRQDRDRLAGGITTTSKQQLEIRNGKVEGDVITFEVERKRQDETNHFTYRGTVTGDTIKGTAVLAVKDRKHTLPWIAEHPRPVIDGKWEWTHGGAKRELDVQRDGARLTGTFVMDGKHEYEIDNGSIIGDEVYFEVERERDAEKTLTKFRGTLGDDRIVGKTEFILNDAAPQFEDWEAAKVEPAVENENGGSTRTGQGQGKTRGKRK